MNKFKKKPVVIEAWQFTRENFDKGVPQEIDRNSAKTQHDSNIENHKNKYKM